MQYLKGVNNESKKMMLCYVSFFFFPTHTFKDLIIKYVQLIEGITHTHTHVCICMYVYVQINRHPPAAFTFSFGENWEGKPDAATFGADVGTGCVVNTRIQL